MMGRHDHVGLQPGAVALHQTPLRALLYVSGQQQGQVPRAYPYYTGAIIRRQIHGFGRM